jgi:hypothetical protein
MIGFIAPDIFTQFGITGNYSAVAILHTFRFTVAHALGFSDFTSHILAADFHTHSMAFQITPEVFFAPPNSFLPFLINHLGLPSPELDPIFFRLLFCSAASRQRVGLYSVPSSDCALL